MTARALRLNGWIHHLFLAITLNSSSPQAIVYGYLVPVFFLIAFGSVFRSDSPALLGHMGQILTITILGGACFGFPTALVAERERGIWQRYRLLPVPIASLVFTTMLARVLIIVSAALIQIALARAVYGTPLPAHPGSAVGGFLLVCIAFLGMGLLIAALADNVPAVQALGQCIFLPMIMIGGVGVPLTALPDWAQRAAGFMPGRYAVELLQPSFDGRNPLANAIPRMAALAAIGVAGGLAGSKLFRWEAGKRIGRTARWWVTASLASWIAVGAIAWQTGASDPVAPTGPWMDITEGEIALITYDDLPRDDDLVTRMAPSTLDPSKTGTLERSLDSWPSGRVSDPGQSIRNLVCAAAVADLSADPREADLARLIFRLIKARFDPAVARQALAWIILSPDDGEALTKAPELGLFRHPPQRLVRQRSVMYAKKYLGRLVGKIPD